MEIRVSRSVVEGSVRAPPSKSYTHRAFFAALLARGESLIDQPLVSGDTRATMSAVSRLGAGIDVSGGSALVRSRGSLQWPKYIYCRGSATTLRIAMAVASLAPGVSLLYGDKSLNRRPVEPLAEALRALGASVITSGGRPPVAVSGLSWGCCEGMVARVDAGLSSQFATALLMIAPLTGVYVEPARLSSKPYLDLTLRVLRAFGVVARWSGGVIEVSGGYRPSRFSVPGDYSSASFMLVAGAIAGRVRVESLEPDDPQGDRAVVDLLRMAGAKVRVSAEGRWVEAESAGVLEPFEADLSDTPDLAPPAAILAAYARGVSVLRGLERLRYKESDRLSAIALNLRRLGVDARIACGGSCLEVRGGRVVGGRVAGYGDHRIIMAFAVAGLASEKGVTVSGASRYTDSYPGFLESLKSLGARVEVV